MKSARSFLLAGISATAASLAACGGSSSPPTTSLVSVMLTQAPPATLQVGATAMVTAQVMNDPTGKGVDWMVTCGSAACGTLNPAHTPSGMSTTYTAPSPFTTNAPVTVTAKATADCTKMASAAVTITAPAASNAPFWGQWAGGPQHASNAAVAGQGLAHQLANVIYDPFVAQEQAENAPLFGEPVLTVHYQSPLIDGNDVYMLIEGRMYTDCNPPGAWGVSPYPACGPNAWNTKTWGEQRFTWESGTLEPVWTYVSDWKPETSGFGLYGWEPVFHAVDANGFIYMPGASGAIWKINKADGTVATHISPSFGGVMIDPKNTFVSSPLTADTHGTIYYNVIELADPSQGDPWFQNDVVGAWLVKVTSADAASSVTYATLVPNAPAPTSTNCPTTFNNLFDNGASLPWPPSPTAVPPPNTLPCGSQRPGANLAPAVGPDGTIYTGSLSHFDSLASFMVAVNPDLSRSGPPLCKICWTTAAEWWFPSRQPTIPTSPIPAGTARRWAWIPRPMRKAMDSSRTRHPQPPRCCRTGPCCWACSPTVPINAGT